jgi:uncharacterized protein YdhG (YjbR/CyaY superfamily)
MPENEPAGKARKATRSSVKSSQVFTAEEKAAMKEHARAMKAAAAGADGEREVLAKIARMKEPDRRLAKRVHALISTSAPDLAPRLWYGMPAYAKNGKVLCYFQDAQKFKSRYATLGFSDVADLDNGEFWPVVFALKNMTDKEETKIRALVKKAVR